MTSETKNVNCPCPLYNCIPLGSTYTSSRKDVYEPRWQIHSKGEARDFWTTFIPGMPGSSGGDHSGSVEILDSEGKSMGRALIPMMQMLVDLQWEEDGAHIPVVAYWNFKEKKCTFWTEAHDREKICPTWFVDLKIFQSNKQFPLVSIGRRI